MKKRSFVMVLTVAMVLVLSLVLVAGASALPGGPYLTSVSPSSGSSATAGNYQLTIYGVNLDDFYDMDVTLYQSGGSGTIVATNPYVGFLGDSIVCNINTYGKPAGTYNVEVYGMFRIGQMFPEAIYLDGAFTVTGAPVATPYIASVSPNTIVAGSPGFSITVYGTSFASGIGATTTVYWNNTALTTTANNAIQATALVPAALVATPGSANITVRTSMSTFPPTIQTSNAVPFSVTAVLPTLTNLNPAQTWAKLISPPLVTLTGTNFQNTAQVLANGVLHASTYVSANQITVQLTAADIANAGTINFAVRNGATGVPTAALPFSVNAETTIPVVTISGADALWHNQPVMLTVNATDSQSGIQKVMYLIASMPFTTLNGSTITVPGPQGGDTNGVNTVQVYALDNTGAQSTTAQATVNICTTGPQTEAFAPSSVKKGKKCKISYVCDSITPQCNSIKIKIYNSNGNVKKTINAGTKTSGQQYSISFTCNLSPGTYKVGVQAVDAAGNAQSSMDKDSFQVKK